MGDAVLSGEYSTRAAGEGSPTARNVVKPHTEVLSKIMKIGKVGGGRSIVKPS
jgi:hypothetical protein